MDVLIDFVSLKVCTQIANTIIRKFEKYIFYNNNKTSYMYTTLATFLIVQVCLVGNQRKPVITCRVSIKVARGEGQHISTLPFGHPWLYFMECRLAQTDIVVYKGESFSVQLPIFVILNDHPFVELVVKAKKL